ncbi:hypothetical protein Noc_0748 [Nitrosococcus oceani ATCC 19707]|uniref:Methyltransferase type 11 domain-containing protein n=2 Tax=Nitrosococcus oceani TaxID=1229 RepID=Q3JD35_NITOC|nr:methyltransferase domain-containing protein [Nitrosococcus oceani]ABA57261.1 hypothetical protein Noc_0748 [Nitrosococcus oceani ATCC 19707]EDZ66612.1 hypothetical protein NOC27_3292 [Nitrosococcus oceani AFC27]KFI20235.1 hypothetical protein IB75_03760 [Nitrosococcus oceani C-27]GEM20133.1 hypothetical protein NONS58_15400 [Nitrosococcus oceani]
MENNETEITQSSFNLTKNLQKVCDVTDWFDSRIDYIIRNNLRSYPTFHRKQWEFAMLFLALSEEKILHEDAIGIVFGAGAERLLFSICEKVKKLIATDLYSASSNWIGARTSNPKQFILDHAPFPIDTDRLDAAYMDMRSIEYPNDTFDFCYSSCAFEHIAEDDAGFLEHLLEVNRTLKEGGVYAMTTELTYNDETVRIPNNHLFEINHLLGLIQSSGLHAKPVFNAKLSENMLNEPMPSPEDFGFNYGKHWIPHVTLLRHGRIFTSCMLILKKDSNRLPGFPVIEGLEKSKAFVRRTLNKQIEKVWKDWQYISPTRGEKDKSNAIIGHENFIKDSRTKNDFVFHSPYCLFGAGSVEIKIDLFAEDGRQLNVKLVEFNVYPYEREILTEETVEFERGNGTGSTITLRFIANPTKTYAVLGRGAGSFRSITIQARKNKIFPFKPFMLVPQNRFYFIHIPKTAGTTLIPLLDARFDADEICPAQLWRELLTLHQESLPRYRFFRGHFGAGGLKSFLPELPFYLTMLRHPLPLTFSTYKFILREPGTRVHHLVKERNMTFSDFLDSPEMRKKVNDMQVRHLSFDLQHDPDTGPIFLSAESRSAVDKWIQDHEVAISAEQRLERAKRMLHACTWFGLAERFDESMALLSWTFGWPPLGQVQKLRVASGGSNIDDLPEEVREKVLACNELDIALYREAERLFQDRLAGMLSDLMRYAQPGEVVSGTFANNPALVNQLLDRHYRHHLEAQPLLAQESLYLSLKEPLLGSGWHRRERAPADNSTFRWSGPAAESFIDLPLQGGRDWVLEFRIVHALTLDILDSLRVTANGTPLELEMTEGTKETTVRRYRSLIPAKVIANKSSGPVRLVFKVNRTLSPQSLDPANPDERQVGIALNWIRAQPLL